MKEKFHENKLWLGSLNDFPKPSQIDQLRFYIENQKDDIKIVLLGSLTILLGQFLIKILL